jgi:8-oxo-dGTP diphosphatase
MEEYGFGDGVVVVGTYRCRCHTQAFRKNKGVVDHNVVDHNVVDHNVVDHNVVGHNVVDHNVVDHNVVNHNVVNTVSTTGNSNSNSDNVDGHILQQQPEQPLTLPVTNYKKKSLFAGIRRNSHGDGTLALPGGHLELYETWEDCAAREVYEEMNLQLVDDTTRNSSPSDGSSTADGDNDNDTNRCCTSCRIEYLHVVNDIMLKEKKHYVTIFMLVELPAPSSCDSCCDDDTSSTTTTRTKRMIPTNMEPEKCEGWNRYSWDELVTLSETDPEKMFSPLVQLIRDRPNKLLQALGVVTASSS